MLLVADTKDIVEFLECEILRLGEEEVGEDPAEDVPGCVPAESTGGCEGFYEGGPG